MKNIFTKNCLKEKTLGKRLNCLQEKYDYLIELLEKERSDYASEENNTEYAYINEQLEFTKHLIKKVEAEIKSKKRGRGEKNLMFQFFDISI